MNFLIKGYKTSELYVLGFVLFVWAAGYFGLDLSQVFSFAEKVVTATDATTGAVSQMDGDKSTAGFWISALYIGGRQALKAFKTQEPPPKDTG